MAIELRSNDLPALAKTDRALLRNARDRALEVPEVLVTPGSLAVPLADLA